MTTPETLKAARAKIAKRRRWTQEFNARGKSGNPVDPMGKYAVCFCANGALMAASKGTSGGYLDAYSYLQCIEKDFVGFNDSHTHAEVLALFDKAIASLEAK